MTAFSRFQMAFLLGCCRTRRRGQQGDPFVVVSIKPKREAGVFLDYNRNVQYNLVELVVERFDGLPR